MYKTKKSADIAEKKNKTKKTNETWRDTRDSQKDTMWTETALSV